MLFTPRLMLVEDKCVLLRFRDFFSMKLLENMSRWVPPPRHAAARLQMEGQRLILLETNKA